MDKTMEEIIRLATDRDSKYVKGDTSVEDLPEKVAEFGVLLLTKVNDLKGLRGQKLKEELIDMQNKLDDLRKNIYYSKFKIAG